ASRDISSGAGTPRSDRTPADHTTTDTPVPHTVTSSRASARSTHQAECLRAQEFLSSATAGAPESLAYWVHEGTLDRDRSKFLSLLGKPRQAVEAAAHALARYERTSYAHDRAFCEVRLGNGLVLSKEIPEAARVLGDVASLASLSPRLTAELHATRALMRPWGGTQAVTTLDAQLEAYGLMPTATPWWWPGSSGPSS
ncbi:MAG: hypothetical protein JO249_18340, partial [Acidobacteria bacterium]|nr:hypothetical protein [Acidobacteriota bacterium]